jgi:YebC/PmpR family DNA-binding regulatory protein
MSGHSKWANIKRRKGAADSARGKVFTKVIREITVAARIGGGDIGSNPRLRTAVDKARAVSMPRDTMERAIAKGTGENDTATYEETSFEGYGAGGVAVIAFCLTDNRNRTTAEIRYAFTRNAGRLGANGCVSYLFKRRGLITIPAEGTSEDALMMAALDAGAEDVALEGDQYEVLCEPIALEGCRKALVDGHFTVASAEITHIPDSYVTVTGKEAEQVLRMIETLEDNDDVQSVVTNADISESEMEALAGA